jgi:histidinol-phosphatase
VPSPHAADLALALELADLADGVTMAHFRDASLLVDHKDDRTEVTIADRSTETTIRERIALERPGHAVLGEEHGHVGSSDTPWRWIIDPIDATSNFVRGIPVWATLIALEHAGEIVVGVVSAPALRRRWWALRGGGAFADGHPIHVSTVATVAEAHIAYSDIGSFAQLGHADALVELTRSCWRGRGFGDFWMHVLVAEGACDVAVEPVVSLWDLAAVQIVVEEAGGRFTNLRGEARADGGSALSTNGHLHDDVLGRFRA